MLTPITTNCHQQPKRHEHEHEQTVGVAPPFQMVTNALFGNPRNCNINVNSPNFQQCPFPGTAISTQAYEDSKDDLLVDSILCDTDYDV